MKTQNAIFGRSRKSFGSATAYTMNGQNVVRTKPIAVANPRTPAQQAQRARFVGFSSAANSLSVDKLELLFATKETGLNRRTMLQKQLAVAYSAEKQEDGTYLAKFDAADLTTIGSGAEGYVGDLKELEIDGSGFVLTNAQLDDIENNISNFLGTDMLAVVAISEDGCLLAVSDTYYTANELELDIQSSEDELTHIAADIAKKMREHADETNPKANVYLSPLVNAAGDHLQLIGLGTFSVAKRSASSAHTSSN